MRNENFYKGFLKQASWIAPVVGAVGSVLKGAGSWVAKNKMATVGGLLTASELGSGAASGARMASKGPAKAFSVSPVQY